MRTASRRASTLLLASIVVSTVACLTEPWTLAVEGSFTRIIEKADEPKDLFLEAYSAYTKAEREELNDRMVEALAKYRETERILRNVIQQYPRWNPAIVDFRLKKTLEAIARLTKSMPKPGPLPEA